jgi:hypothetical protein
MDCPATCTRYADALLDISIFFLEQSLHWYLLLIWFLNSIVIMKILGNLLAGTHSQEVLLTFGLRQA